ncbi:hypothetical protein TNCT_405271 [Trichonephila clavata]|uniref:Uncharacterized protein n=1 Tax=Trichonephila clavata TaxID=2740835 RepID=A0A8X6ISY1_TRICU|nr:hypothetical protein TNCT_405271 [Trichonephila clavata]
MLRSVPHALRDNFKFDESLSPLIYLLITAQLMDARNFQSLLNAMRGDSFDTDAEFKAWLNEFIRVKTSDFYQRSTEDLFERLGEVVSKGGQIID